MRVWVFVPHPNNDVRPRVTVSSLSALGTTTSGIYSLILEGLGEYVHDDGVEEKRITAGETGRRAPAEHH